MPRSVMRTVGMTASCTNDSACNGGVGDYPAHTAGTAVLGIMLFHEPRDVLRLSCLTLIIAGAVGLKFLAPPGQAAQLPMPSTGEAGRCR